MKKRCFFLTMAACTALALSSCAENTEVDTPAYSTEDGESAPLNEATETITSTETESEASTETESETAKETESQTAKETEYKMVELEEVPTFAISDDLLMVGCSLGDPKASTQYAVYTHGTLTIIETGSEYHEAEDRGIWQYENMELVDLDYNSYELNAVTSNGEILTFFEGRLIEQSGDLLPDYFMTLSLLGMTGVKHIDYSSSWSNIKNAFIITEDPANSVLLPGFGCGEIVYSDAPGYEVDLRDDFNKIKTQYDYFAVGNRCFAAWNKSESPVIFGEPYYESLAEEVSGWTEIDELYFHDDCALALKTDGSVCSSDEKMNQVLQSWVNIESIKVNAYYVAGLSKDGRIHAISWENEKEEDLSDCEDAVDFAMGDFNLWIMKEDGFIESRTLAETK